MKSLFWRFVKDQSGATAIEYSLIAARVAVASIGALQLLGTNLNTKFNTAATTLSSVP
jgi:pilus assembly protein Flp/PilA